MGAWRHALSLDSVSQLVLLGRGIWPWALTPRWQGAWECRLCSEPPAVAWIYHSPPCTDCSRSHLFGPWSPHCRREKRTCLWAAVPKGLDARGGLEPGAEDRAHHCQAGLFVSFLCNCGTIHIELTLLTVFRCPVQRHSAHSHSCAATITVHPHSFFIFPNHNSVPVEQYIASPLPSPWRPPFHFLSLRV